MGWTTCLTTTIEYNKEVYNNLYEVKHAISECEYLIASIKKDLLNFATMTEPQKFCPTDSDPLYWIKEEVESNLELLEEKYIDLYKLELLRSNWQYCHNDEGLAIPPPKGMADAYLEGSFINTAENNYEVQEQTKETSC